MSRRRRQYSRAMLLDLRKADAKIRASLSDQVKVLTPDEVEAIAEDLQQPAPPKLTDHREVYYPAWRD
jgi:hypothetical protein